MRAPICSFFTAVTPPKLLSKNARGTAVVGVTLIAVRRVLIGLNDIRSPEVRARVLSPASASRNTHTHV